MEIVKRESLPPDDFRIRQLRARDMLLGLPVAVDGTPEEVLFPGIVPKLTATPGTVRSAAPRLGEDTDAVLRGMGKWEKASRGTPEVVRIVTCPPTAGSIV